MADLLETGAAWLATQQAAHAASEVVYSRGQQQASVKAVRGRTLFQLTSPDGVVLQTESVDFLILTSALVLNGLAVEPQAGDRITKQVGGKSLLYEVMAPGSEPCFRYTDAYRHMLRIHTKLIGTEDAP